MAKCNHLVFMHNENVNKQFLSVYADGKVVKTFAYANKFCPKCGKLIERPTKGEKQK